MYAIASIEDINRDELNDFSPGVIFILKQTSFSEIESSELNALYPYYLIHIQDDGEIKFTYSQAKYVLDIFKKLSLGKSSIDQDLVEAFNQETKEASDMSKYSRLLKDSIYHIIGRKQEEGLAQLFSKLGKTNIASDSRLSGLEDFELVSFLIIK